MIHPSLHIGTNLYKTSDVKLRLYFLDIKDANP